MLLSFSARSQTYVEIVEYAEEQSAIGDYYDAIQWYKKALAIDSSSVELLWKYAEALRLYKDYESAEFYYWKVYSKEYAKIYKLSIFWLATMQKYNGRYEESLDSWFKVRKVFKTELDGFEMAKAKQEITSCLWAQKAIEDSTDFIVKPIEGPVSSQDSELAPSFFGDHLYFTAMKADSVGKDERVNPHLPEVKKQEDIEYSIQIHKAERTSDTTFDEVTALKDVQEKGFNTANGSFSPDGKRFYFSRCKGNDCNIFVGAVQDGRISEIDSLGDIINEPGYMATMPHSALVNGKEVLFFCSNMNFNYGGLDIWMSEVKNGNQYSLPKSLGETINSRGNEITPYYDESFERLYFSSDWHEGFGGFDLFFTQKDSADWAKPMNLGVPVNSTYNDTYPTKDPKTGRLYFSSNRIGVNSAKSPTCCNDLFSAHIYEPPPPNRFESLADLNKKLPVVLYFHNDVPEPRSQDTTTLQNYTSTYVKYRGMEEQYKKEYSAGLTDDEAEDAKIDMEDFFLQYVEQGVRDLEEFTRLLILELDKGYDIEMTIRGFASPLADTDYNVKLTKRRINSLRNYLREYEGGVFQKYINKFADNGGRLTFNAIPYGEYTSADKLISDNPNDEKNSVYSRHAALERKIVIQSVSFVYSDSVYAKMLFSNQQHDFGYVQPGTQLENTFHFTNTGDKDLEIGEITSECTCVKAELSKTVVKPGESASVKIKWDTTGLSGIKIYHLKILSNVSGGFKEISVSTHIR